MGRRVGIPVGVALGIALGWGLIRGGNPAFFEFAPLNGIGMGAACACTTPTGAKGEALTFSRASSGTCMKAGIYSGISNGDLVTCLADQARVMPGGDGSAPSGLLIEPQRTNVALRSESIDNATWTKDSLNVAAPTITADQAVAPDGTTTADRVQMPATTTSDFSRIYTFDGTLGASNASGSVFVLGRSGSGQIDICLYNNSLPGYSCEQCSFVSTSWTRCTHANIPGGAANGTFTFGNLSNLSGVAHSANDVYVWGGQWEVGASVTSYIKTLGTAVTRSPDKANFASSIATAVATTGSTSATFLRSSGVAAGIYFDDGDGRPLYFGASDFRFYDGTNNPTLSYGTLSQTTPKRLGSDWSGSSSNLRNITDNTSVSGSFDGALAVGSGLFLGGGSTEGTFLYGAMNGVIKQVCVDPSPARCR